MPEIIIVKKVFPKYRKKQKKRNWKLKHIQKEYGAEDDEDENGGSKPIKKSSKKHVQNKEI